MTFAGVAQDRSYRRSMVITDLGIVATSQYLASQAGAQILARGGSAIDAAIAANAVLGVTESMMNGMGGDLFLIYRDVRLPRRSKREAGAAAGCGAAIRLHPRNLH
jgi:gamma-glutamyltranspeptidase/glutathione hydrolase